MALLMRTEGVWRGMSASCSGARVEPTRNASQVLSLSDNTSSILSRRASITNSGDAVLRCQAATLTADWETAEVEMLRLEDSRAALRGSFEAASASGCEECRPVLEEARFLSIAMTETTVDEQRRVYHGRRGGGDWYPGLATTPKLVNNEETPMMGKSEMIASFEAALQEAGRNAEMMARLALRAWRTLGDADRAEALYMKAVELAPGDSTIQASYAEFLWQCDL